MCWGIRPTHADGFRGEPRPGRSAPLFRRPAFIAACLAGISLSCVETSGLEDIDRLEDARDLGRGRLIAYAEAPAGGLRARAARALGRISDPDALPTLGSLLGDRDPAVVREAAFALGLLAIERPEHGARIADILSPRLSDLAELPPATAREVVWAMGVVGSHAPAWWESVATDRRVPVTAELALALAGNPTAEAHVVSLLRHGDPDVRWRAAYAAGRFAGTEGALGGALDDTDPRVRRHAAAALGRLRSPGAAELLQAHLDRGEFDSGVVVAALTAFEFAAPSPKATSTIEKYMHSPTQHVRAAACRALASIGGLGAEGAMLNLAEDTSSLVRAEAARGLARFDAPACADQLVRLAADPSPAVRAAATRGLGGNRPLVVRALADSAGVVRAAAIGALAESGGGDEIRAALDDPDPGVVAVAVRALATTEPGDMLGSLYRPGADARVRLALLRALATRADATPCDFSPFWRDDAASIRREAVLAAATAAPDNGCAVPSMETVSRRGRAITGGGRTVDVDRLQRRATIVTEVGTIDVQLFPRRAPHAVARFLDLASDGVFEGSFPCSIEPDSVLVMGCDGGVRPLETGRSLRRELGPERVARGVLATVEPIADGADAQFFVALRSLPELDGRVTVFGEVELGMDVVERLTPDSQVLRVSTR